jgi:hypothetical protein
MNGLMYAQSFHNDPRCVLIANGKDRELSLSFLDGTCGVSKTVAPVRTDKN